MIYILYSQCVLHIYVCFIQISEFLEEDYQLHQYEQGSQAYDPTEDQQSHVSDEHTYVIEDGFVSSQTQYNQSITNSERVSPFFTPNSMSKGLQGKSNTEAELIRDNLEEVVEQSESPADPTVISTRKPLSLSVIEESLVNDFVEPDFEVSPSKSASEKASPKALDKETSATSAVVQALELDGPDDVKDQSSNPSLNVSQTQRALSLPTFDDTTKINTQTNSFSQNQVDTLKRKYPFSPHDTTQPKKTKK